MFWITVLLHDPFMFQFQLISRWYDSLQHSLIWSKSHTSFKDSKSSRSWGSNVPNPYLHTITSMLENWYKVPIVECRVCFAPDITNPCNKVQFSFPGVWRFNHFTLTPFTISLQSILFYTGKLYLLPLHPYSDLYIVSPQFTTIYFNNNSKLWQLGKSDL